MKKAFTAWKCIQSSLCLWNRTLTMSQAPSGSTREWFSRPNYTSVPWTLIKMKGPEPLLTP